MTRLISSLDAHQDLKATMTACSTKAGWRSLLLRAYVDPPTVDELNTRPTADHLIVLVTGGSCEIEGRYKGRWHKARYRPGMLGMTAPGEAATLRWHGHTTHETLQLHLPSATLQATAAEMPKTGRPAGLPSRLGDEDTVIRQTMLSLAAAMAEGAPDLYAETAAEFLVAHLLLRHGRHHMPPPAHEDVRLRRVDDYMREHLADPLSLTALAEVACISRFHFLRLFKQTYGETPLKRLTRLRMEDARERLAGNQSIAEIAFASGYENSAHFAVAFRKIFGVAPSVYRRDIR
ncbi:AraC family transcriptional regulator [Bradyrhizobium prioriisuperbiae]|uniref:AraC family transcriptional regulator n=1 Tax=Bradyrhizobium prioriisuperbiae TaxID=2854389 RepID=UPI0028E985B9|nr:AraC family transcriptional regulator [Bradyrhizobium prioritasuperba]